MMDTRKGLARYVYRKQYCYLGTQGTNQLNQLIQNTRPARKYFLFVVSYPFTDTSKFSNISHHHVYQIQIPLTNESVVPFRLFFVVIRTTPVLYSSFLSYPIQDTLGKVHRYAVLCLPINRDLCIPVFFNPQPISLCR